MALVGSILTLNLLAEVKLIHTLKSVRGDGSNAIVVALWWLNPATVYAGYALGTWDPLCAVLLYYLGSAIRNRQVGRSFLLLTVCGSIKLPLLMLSPFYLGWLLFDRCGVTMVQMRKILALVSYFVVVVVLILSSDGLNETIFGSAELTEVSTFGISLSERLKVPLFAITLTLIVTWLLSRKALFSRHFEYCIMLTLASLSFVAPSGIGWFVWISAPLIMWLHSITKRLIFFMISLQVVITLSSMGWSGPALLRGSDGEGWLGDGYYEKVFDSRIVITFLGVIVVAYIIRLWLLDFDPLGVMDRPLLVAIAGDSGAGKSTLSRSLIDYFGTNERQIFRTDDYHRFERGHSFWNRTTHLDMSANLNSQISKELTLILAGEIVNSVAYDHGSGRFAGTTRSLNGPVVVVDGLHSISIRNSVAAYDALIYLSCDESLHTFFKVSRDVRERGAKYDDVIDLLERRRPQFEQYVEPQRRESTLAMNLFCLGSNVSGILDDWRIEGRPTIDELPPESLAVEIECGDAPFLRVLESELMLLSACWFRYEENSQGARLIVHPGRLSGIENLKLLGRDPQWLGFGVEVCADGLEGTSGFLSVVAIKHVLHRRVMKAHVL